MEPQDPSKVTEYNHVPVGTKPVISNIVFKRICEAIERGESVDEELSQYSLVEGQRNLIATLRERQAVANQTSI